MSINLIISLLRIFIMKNQTRVYSVLYAKLLLIYCFKREFILSKVVKNFYMYLYMFILHHVDVSKNLIFIKSVKLVFIS